MQTLKCDICGKEYQNAAGLSSHMAHAHPSVNSELITSLLGLHSDALKVLGERQLALVDLAKTYGKEIVELVNLAKTYGKEIAELSSRQSELSSRQTELSEFLNFLAKSDLEAIARDQTTLEIIGGLQDGCIKSFDVITLWIESQSGQSKVIKLNAKK